MTKQPTGELSIKTIAMPENTNANGDIFGGWLISQMDLAACIIAKQKAKGRVATIAIDRMVFHHPVQVGDVLCCYCDIIKIGDSSMKINVEAWIIDHIKNELNQVTQGIFTFVAINEHGRPRSVLNE